MKRASDVTAIGDLELAPPPPRRVGEMRKISVNDDCSKITTTTSENFFEKLPRQNASRLRPRLGRPRQRPTALARASAPAGWPPHTPSSLSCSRARGTRPPHLAHAHFYFTADHLQRIYHGPATTPARHTPRTKRPPRSRERARGRAAHRRPQYRGPTTEDEYAHRTPPHTFIYSFSRLLLTNASPPRATRQNRQPARSRGATNKTAYLPSKTVYDRQKLPTDRPPTAHAHSAPRKTAQKSATPVHRRPPPMRRRSTLTHIAGEGALSQPTSLLPARGEVHPRPLSGEGTAHFSTITVPNTTYPLGVTHLALGKGAFE